MINNPEPNNLESNRTNMGLPLAPPTAPAPIIEDPRKRWGAWATLGFGTLIFLISSTIQAIVVIIFIANQILTDGNFNPNLIMNLMYNGLMLSVATITSGIVGVGATYVFIKIRNQFSFKDYLELYPLKAKTVLWVLGAAAALIIASYFIEPNFDQSQNLNFTLETYKTAVWPPLFWIAVVVFAPLFEEILFRGFLFVGLRKSMIGAAGTIIVTSLLWAALHAQYNVYGMVSIFILGILLGIVRLKTGSLWAPILFHALWNLVSIVITALYVNGMIQ